MENEIFEEIKRKYKKSNKYMLYVSYEDIGTLLNLIEKQSKEIEELKVINQMQKYRIEVIDERELISKDKIKAKIEELQDDIKYSANPLSIDNSKFGIKVLQSLLEKEE